YLATNGVEVRLDAVERTGEILDLVVQAGATTISGVSFDLQDRATAELEALRLAVVDARARAEAAATGAGRTLGAILRIEDAFQPPMPPMPMMSFAREAADMQVQTPVAAGEIEIRALVTITVAIQ
ncbi:MAG: SIMPL domain-containing protein, partial [Vicinamibacterales bacterium]